MDMHRAMAAEEVAVLSETKGVFADAAFVWFCCRFRRQNDICLCPMDRWEIHRTGCVDPPSVCGMTKRASVMATCRTDTCWVNTPIRKTCRDISFTGKTKPLISRKFFISDTVTTYMNGGLTSITINNRVSFIRCKYSTNGARSNYMEERKVYC